MTSEPSSGADHAHWSNFLPAREARKYDLEPLSNPPVLSRPTALLVIDTTIAFTGRSPELSYEQATAEFRTACGPDAWGAVTTISGLLSHFRSAARPIIYTRALLSTRAILGGGATRSARGHTVSPTRPPDGNEFHPLVHPREDELILDKPRASAFFETHLRSILQALTIQNVVVVGATTSGCVRATVQDSFSCGYQTYVPSDACFDRSDTLHRANLWDMNAKYAHVLPAQSIADAISCS